MTCPKCGEKKVFIIEWESPNLRAIWTDEVEAQSKEEAEENFIIDKGQDIHIRSVEEKKEQPRDE